MDSEDRAVINKLNLSLWSQIWDINILILLLKTGSNISQRAELVKQNVLDGRFCFIMLCSIGFEPRVAAPSKERRFRAKREANPTRGASSKLKSFSEKFLRATRSVAHCFTGISPTFLFRKVRFVQRIKIVSCSFHKDKRVIARPFIVCPSLINRCPFRL